MVFIALGGEKKPLPTQLKDFDAFLLLPIFESLKIQKRLEMRARVPFCKAMCKKTLQSIGSAPGDAPGVAS